MVPRRTPLLSEKDTEAHLGFAKLRVNKTEQKRPNTQYQQTPRGDGGVRIGAPCSHWVDRELLCITTFSRV